jgi:hypothetical protein
MRNKKIVFLTVALVMGAGLIGIAHSRQWINWFERKADNEVDGKQELKNLYSRYIDTKLDFNISGIIFLYDRENNNALKEQAPFRHFKRGADYFMQLSHQKTYVHNGIVAQVDTLNKFIIVSKADTSLQAIAAGTSFPFEKFMADTSVFKITATVADNGKQRTLKLYNELMPQIKSAMICYNPADYTVNKTEIEWWKEQGITEKANEKKCWLSSITYSYNTNTAFNVGEELAKIITIADQVVRPSEKYKDYEITVSLDDSFQ